MTVDVTVPAAEAVPSPPAEPGRMPALYLGHGAPPLLEDAQWMAELNGWARDLPRPTSILMVSAHWQTAPMAIGATTTVPLVYDFYGFPEHFYQLEYRSPGAPAARARQRRPRAAACPPRAAPSRWPCG